MRQPRRSPSPDVAVARGGGSSGDRLTNSRWEGSLAIGIAEERGRDRVSSEWSVVNISESRRRELYDLGIWAARGYKLDAEEIHDIVMDSFDAFRGASIQPWLLPPGEQKAYFRAIVRNRCNKTWNKRRREQEKDLRYAEHTETRGTSVVECFSDEIEIWKSAAEAVLVETQDPQRCEIERLHYEGESLTSVQRRLGLSKAPEKRRAFWHRVLAEARRRGTDAPGWSGGAVLPPDLWLLLEDACTERGYNV